MSSYYPAAIFHYKTGFVGVVKNGREHKLLTERIGGVFTSYPLVDIENWNEVKENLNESDIKLRRFL